MKIVNKKTFMATPAGTVFARYRPVDFGEICIKGDNVPNSSSDFYCQTLISIDALDIGEVLELTEKSIEEGTSFNLDLHYEGREALYDDKELFAIWEHKDLEQLIDRLKEAFEMSKPKADAVQG